MVVVLWGFHFLVVFSHRNRNYPWKAAIPRKLGFQWLFKGEGWSHSHLHRKFSIWDGKRLGHTKCLMSCPNNHGNNNSNYNQFSPFLKINSNSYRGNHKFRSYALDLHGFGISVVMIHGRSEVKMFFFRGENKGVSNLWTKFGVRVREYIGSIWWWRFFFIMLFLWIESPKIFDSMSFFFAFDPNQTWDFRHLRYQFISINQIATLRLLTWSCHVDWELHSWIPVAEGNPFGQTH